MRKALIYTTFWLLLTTLPIGFAAADQYDDLVNELANSILEQIHNDVPPVETSGNLDIPTPESNLPEGVFFEVNNSFTLTPASLNARLNGWVLVEKYADAISYLHTQQLTKYNTEASFQTENHLRRDEAAKFFGLFASQVMKKQSDTTKTCEFKDLAEWHTDLKSNVIAACQLGIFRGKDGYFNPTGSLTNGEALTVLIRIIYWALDESHTDHRAKDYLLKAQSYGLTQGTLLDSMKYLDTPATRWDVARLLEAARFIPLLKEELWGDITYSLNSQSYIRTK